MSDEMKIDFGDGVSALDRTMRAITLIAGEAIGRLTDLGWKRSRISMEISEADPLPCYVKLGKRRLFRIAHRVQDDGRISIHGEWIEDPRAPGIIDRFMGHA